MKKTKGEKYLHVLALMKTKGGYVRLDDEDLLALLGRVKLGDQFPEDDTRRVSLLYRMPTYISYIRKFAHLEVDGIREGRKVVAYKLVAMAPVVHDDDPFSDFYKMKQADPPVTVE